MIRTYNPWGHVSRAERVRRAELAANISAHAVLKREPEWEEFESLLRAAHAGHASKEAKERVNEIAMLFNNRGYSDRQIERAVSGA
jgi:N-acetyl-anhydromuramyl-L-alanine amidase AmpD